MEETSEQDASRGLPEMRCSLHDCIKVSEDSARIYSDTNGNCLTELSLKLVFDSDNDPRRVNIVQIWNLKFLFYVSIKLRILFSFEDGTGVDTEVPR
jgi:hypothetical protein